MIKPRASGNQSTTQSAKRSPEDRHRNMRILDEERAHFSFGANDLQSTIRTLDPLIRKYARGGVRKPKDVARELNATGVRTACGDKWSPRLTWLLLAMVFEKGEPGSGLWQRSKLSKLPRPARRPTTRTRPPPGISSLDALPNPLRADLPDRRHYK